MSAEKIAPGDSDAAHIVKWTAVESSWDKHETDRSLEPTVEEPKEDNLWTFEEFLEYRKEEELHLGEWRKNDGTAFCMNWRKDGVGATFKCRRENRICAILQDLHLGTESHTTALEVPTTVFLEWAERVSAIGKCNRKQLRWWVWGNPKESMKRFPSF